jgi:TetR/AcrR family transcriptional repressor of mexJK operon
MEKPPHDAPCCLRKSAGRPKAADVEARTQDLLQVAARLFLKNGYTKTSLESIARAAHVAVRTIYVKFGGKAGLLDAVLVAQARPFLPHARRWNPTTRRSAKSSTISRASCTTC